MGNGTRENENTMDGQGYEKEVKISIVSLPNTIAHPRTMMVKSLNTIVAYGAMGCARRPKYSTSKTILEINDSVYLSCVTVSHW